MLLRQQQQQQPSLDHSQPTLESTADADIRRRTTWNAAAYPVVSLDGVAVQAGALLKPRRTSSAALPLDFAPSKVDIVVELRSESPNRRSSSSSPSSDVAFAPDANACCCNLVGSAPAFEAMLNRYLLPYIESSRRSRSHLIDHVLALVQRSGGLFCRFDQSCHRWIQVGYETSFDACASDFKAGAREILKRIQLLRSLERQDHESRVEMVEQPPSAAVQPITPMSHGHSQDQGLNVLLTGLQQPSADSQGVHPKPPPGPPRRPRASVNLHQPVTLSPHETPSSQRSVPGSVASNPDSSSGPISSREHKLKPSSSGPK